MEHTIKMDDLGGENHHFRKPPFLAIRKTPNHFDYNHHQNQRRDTQLMKPGFISIAVPPGQKRQGLNR